MQLSHSRWFAAGAVLIGCVFSAAGVGVPPAATPAKPVAFPKPAWLADFSLGIKESYDDNVFVSGVNPNSLPPYVVPNGSVAALENQSSWVTTASPKLGFNFAPLFGSKNLEALSLSYSPDFVIYHNEPTESYNAHRIAAAIKARAGSFSVSADNAFSFIDGHDTGPFYPGAFSSAYGSAFVRERREQIQDRAKLAFRYDTDRWFIRPTASLLYYDLMTEQRNVTGYQNYVDRYDVNGGLDLGCKISAPVALTLGYRRGHQGQDKLSFSPYSSPSDYHRVLFGVEGKPLKWLKVEFQLGPDFRSYPADTATRISPVTDKTPVTYYGEGTLTADLTAKDALAFKYKQFQWVSSTGKVPYFDSSCDLSYHRKLSDHLAFDLGARFAASDYNVGNLPTCMRNDLQYTLTTGVGYSLNPHVAFNAGYAADLGRNAQDNIASPGNREFNRNIVSLGLMVKW